MEKFRGQRRYYRNLAIRNEFEKTIFLDLQNDPNAWYYQWHYHFDLFVRSNSFKKRKPHLDKLFRHFEMLIEKTKCLKVEFQLYVFIFDKSSNHDAVFLNTANPYGNFPLAWENLSENCTLKNQDLVEYVNQLNEYEKLYGIAENEPFCILIKEGVGISKALYQTEFQMSIKELTEEQRVWN